MWYGARPYREVHITIFNRRINNRNSTNKHNKVKKKKNEVHIVILLHIHTLMMGAVMQVTNLPIRSNLE